jgi:hypothetical protein
VDWIPIPLAVGLTCAAGMAMLGLRGRSRRTMVVEASRLRPELVGDGFLIPRGARRPPGSVLRLRPG